MKRVRLYEALMIMGTIFSVSCFFCSDVKPTNSQECLSKDSNALEPYYSVVFRHCKKTFLEAFIMDAEGSTEIESVLGKKIQYRNGIQVVQKNNGTWLYKDNVIYVFNRDGILTKEIGT
jgi:hypothetical protein